MTYMPETIYAGIPANGKTRSGSYSHSPIPVNQHGKPSSRKCNPRVKYIRADKYEALKQSHDRLVARLKDLDLLLDQADRIEVNSPAHRQIKDDITESEKVKEGE